MILHFTRCQCCAVLPPDLLLGRLLLLRLVNPFPSPNLSPLSSLLLWSSRFPLGLDRWSHLQLSPNLNAAIDLDLLLVVLPWRFLFLGWLRDRDLRLVRCPVYL